MRGALFLDKHFFFVLVENYQIRPTFVENTRSPTDDEYADNFNKVREVPADCLN